MYFFAFFAIVILFSMLLLYIFQSLLISIKTAAGVVASRTVVVALPDL